MRDHIYLYKNKGEEKMKKLTTIINRGLMFLIMILTLTKFVQGRQPEENIKLIESNKAVVENLVKGISSDNYGLRISAAVTIGQLVDSEVILPGKFTKAIIPLLAMLNRENDEAEKLIAALTLYKLENNIGMYRIKRAIQYEKSDRVKRVYQNLCDNFYNKK
jgi:hypothetical protein